MVCRNSVVVNAPVEKGTNAKLYFLKRRNIGFAEIVTYSSLLRMSKAPITPGTQPHKVNKKTIAIEPHPLSHTASGGKMIANRTRKQDI